MLTLSWWLLVLLAVLGSALGVALAWLWIAVRDYRRAVRDYRRARARRQGSEAILLRTAEPLTDADVKALGEMFPHIADSAEWILKQRRAAEPEIREERT